MSQTTVTILDDEPGGEIGFAAATYAVGEAKPSVVIGLRREKGLASGVGVSVCTGNGTATAGEDFEAVVTNLVFGASQVRLTNMVRIWQDPRAEGNETVSLRLANPRGGAVLGSVSSAWLTIADDEFSVQGIFKGSGSLSFHDCADRASNLSSLVSGEIHLFDVAPNRFSGKGALLAAYGPSTVLSLSGTVDGGGRLAFTSSRRPDRIRGRLRRATWRWAWPQPAPSPGRASRRDPSTAGLFSLLPPVQGKPSGVEVCWTSMADRLYAVERCTNLSAVPCVVMVQHGVLGQTNTTCFTDQRATNHLPSFYRVRVER